MARTTKVVCDKCKAEEEFLGKYAEGWSLLEVIHTPGENDKYELCPKCTKAARP